MVCRKNKQKMNNANCVLQMSCGRNKAQQSTETVDADEWRALARRLVEQVQQTRK